MRPPSSRSRVPREPDRPFLPGRSYEDMQRRRRSPTPPDDRSSGCSIQNFRCNLASAARLRIDLSPPRSAKRTLSRLHPAAVRCESHEPPPLVYTQPPSCVSHTVCAEQAHNSTLSAAINNQNSFSSPNRLNRKERPCAFVFLLLMNASGFAIMLLDKILPPSPPPDPGERCCWRLRHLRQPRRAGGHVCLPPQDRKPLFTVTVPLLLACTIYISPLITGAACACPLLSTI